MGPVQIKGQYAQGPRQIIGKGPNGPGPMPISYGPICPKARPIICLLSLLCLLGAIVPIVPIVVWCSYSAIVVVAALHLSATLPAPQLCSNLSISAQRLTTTTNEPE